MVHFSGKIQVLALSAAVLLFLMVPFTASAQTSGAVFVNANSTANEIWSYTRGVDGTLTFAGSFSTQGAGSGNTHLESQGSLVLSANKQFLFAVNANSNDITAFQVQPGAQLAFVGKYPSGGLFPNSVALSGTLLYVLNQGSDQVNAFRVSSTTGALKPISASARKLSTTGGGGAQVSFNPSGKVLMVVEKVANNLDTFTIDSTGKATGPSVFSSAGKAPLGFAFDAKQHVIVSEVTASSISSYGVSSSGSLSVITGVLKDKGKAACWVANTNNPAFPNQYSYVTNTNSDTVTGLKIGSDGSLTLLNPTNGITAQLSAGAFPLDEVVDSSSTYLYVLQGHLPGVGAFHINSDGSLTEVQTLTGLPSTSWGIAGY